MSTLAEALANHGVPEPPEPQPIAAFGDMLLPWLDSLTSAENLADVPEWNLPELVALADASARADHAATTLLIDILVEWFASTDKSMVFLAASDVAVVCPTLLTRAGSGIAEACWRRFHTQRATNGHAAYHALQTIARLALTGATRELRLLDTLLGLTLNDPPELLEGAVRLLGLADEQWQETRCRETLRILVGLPTAAVDATIELGLAELRDGLNAGDITEALSRLAAARELFASAEAAEEARDDAAAYRRVLDAVLAFGSPDAAATLAQLSDELDSILARRRAWLTGTHVPQWLAPRAQSEAEWGTLATILRTAAHDITKASWVRPAEALARVLAAYQASRSLHVVPSATGVAAIIEPVIEAAFLTREGLRAHLEDLLSTPEFAENPAGKRLLKRLLTDPPPQSSGDAWGKAFAAAPELTQRVGPEHAAAVLALAEQDPGFLVVVEAALHDAASAARRTGDPLVDQLLAQLTNHLTVCPEFTGTVRQEFVTLVTYTLRFLVDRADISRTTGGQRVEYLFSWPNGAEPWRERELQRDYREFLAASDLRRIVRIEESDIASGRADVTVTFPSARFVIEVKRELANASRDGIITSYAGQTVSYAATSVPLGMLLVLDLTPHPYGAPRVTESIWCDRIDIPNSGTRFLVTGVVRGNRSLPSATRTAP